MSAGTNPGVEVVKDGNVVSYNQHWWKLEHDDIHDSITAIIQNLDDNQSYRTHANLRNLKLYSNLAITGFGSGEYAEQRLPPNRLTLNVVESVIEAAKALIATNKPKVKFLTEGAGYQQRKQAQKLTEFTSGMFYQTDAYRIARKVFADGAIFGTGAMRPIYTKDGEIILERIFTEDILVDDVEAKYGQPRSLYLHQEIERSVLREMYPKHAERIGESDRMREDGFQYTSFLADPVSVVTAWHLPTPGNSDGRFAVVTSGATLDSGEWKENDFPLVVFRWSERALGYWGKGLAEILRGVQIEINLLLQKIQRLMNLASSKVFVPRGSKVNKAKLNNEEWGIVDYTGDRPPVFAITQAVAPEYYKQLESLYQKAFEIAGISQMAAQSKKPAGLESGKAIREYNDIQTQRFLHIGQDWENLFVDLAGKLIMCAKANKDYTVLAENDGILERIKWADVDPKKDAFRMKAWPASLLPDTPAGKLEAVQELISIDPRFQPYAMKLLNFPDLEAAMKRINAPVIIVDKIIDRILDGGDLIPPEPYMDLPAAVTQMQHAYLESLINEVDESKLDLMRRWIDVANGMMKLEMEAQQAEMMAAMPPPAPGGAPMGGEAPAMPGAQPFAPVGANVPGM